jgi:hypothetical protein
MDSEELRKKKEKLSKGGFDMIQKTMLKQALGGLSFIALEMKVSPTDMIINLVVHDNNDVSIMITNWVNDEMLDYTEAAKDMADDEPMFEEFIEELKAIMKECAEFWNTTPDNIKFKCWTAAGMDIGADICPMIGFPETERLFLTEARQRMTT